MTSRLPNSAGVAYRIIITPYIYMVTIYFSSNAGGQQSLQQCWWVKFNNLSQRKKIMLNEMKAAQQWYTQYTHTESTKKQF